MLVFMNVVSVREIHLLSTLPSQVESGVFYCRKDEEKAVNAQSLVPFDGSREDKEKNTFVEVEA